MEIIDTNDINDTNDTNKIITILLKSFGTVHTDVIEEAINEKDSNEKNRTTRETVYIHDACVDTDDNKTYIIPYMRLEKVKYSVKVKKTKYKGQNFGLYQMKLSCDPVVDFHQKEFNIIKINDITIQLKAKINDCNVLEAKLM